MDDTIRRVPWVIMALAALAACIFANTDADVVQTHAGGVFGASLGFALLLWGLEELKDGEIPGKRVGVQRRDSPLCSLYWSQEGGFCRASRWCSVRSGTNSCVKLSFGAPVYRFERHRPVATS